MTHDNALATLGTILDKDQGRDAIHLAVISVIAGETLRPGDNVYLSDQGLAFLNSKEYCVGIVDPFLNTHIKAGQHFWLIIYPRTITSLRHVWEHPLLPSETTKAPQSFTKQITEEEKSTQWIEEFAQKLGISYKVLMNGAFQWLEYGEYLCLGSLLEGEYVPEEFWDHYSIVVKEQISDNKRESFFTCSC
jgi:hypothetical protein